MTAAARSAAIIAEDAARERDIQLHPARPSGGPFLLRPGRAVAAARSAAWQLAEYYGWSARHEFTPVGRDPRTGRAWSPADPLARRIARVEAIAAARVAYAAARAYGPMPLP